MTQLPGKVAETLCELVSETIGQYEEIGQRIIANRLLKLLESWMPQTERKPKAKENEKMTADIFALDDLSPDVKEALALVEEIESLVEELPDAGEEFGESVLEKASDIAATIEANDRVTDGQMTALENMLDGVQRWFHD